jgi:hypothetical protein
MNASMVIGYSEWKEIMAIPAVEDAWGLTTENVHQFASAVCDPIHFTPTSRTILAAY